MPHTHHPALTVTSMQPQSFSFHLDLRPLPPTVLF